jgi:hypothetical protein
VSRIDKSNFINNKARRDRDRPVWGLTATEVQADSGALSITVANDEPGALSCKAIVTTETRGVLMSSGTRSLSFTESGMVVTDGTKTTTVGYTYIPTGVVARYTLVWRDIGEVYGFIDGRRFG